jgi:isopenicillin N synthase-like dioxygenase
LHKPFAPPPHPECCPGPFRAGVPAGHLPVINLAELGDSTRHTPAHARLARIARDIGFFYLEGHGIAPEQIERLEAVARQFFALPPR